MKVLLALPVVVRNVLLGDGQPVLVNKPFIHTIDLNMIQPCRLNLKQKFLQLNLYNHVGGQSTQHTDERANRLKDRQIVK
jgi:hypothetical protein